MAHVAGISAGDERAALAGAHYTTLDLSAHSLAAREAVRYRR